MCFALGISVYYNTPAAIPASVPLTLAFSFAALFFTSGKFHNIFISASLVFTCGLSYSAVRTDFIDNQFIEKNSFFTGQAIVVDVEERSTGFTRLTLEDLIPQNKDAKQYTRVRLFARTEIPRYLLAGDRVKFSAVLERPQGKITPNGYDFARAAFFDGIQATGYVTTPVTIMVAEEKPGFSVNALRQSLAAKVIEVIPGQAGALAAALLVGRRSHLSADSVDNLRASGLAHMLAISGLHMGLFVGAAFFVFEFVLLFVPIRSPYMNSRKLAAIFAWFAALGYLFLSGMSTATIRAFIIVSIAIAAILLDRRVVSLRSIALAALSILLINPHSVLSAGFQMSFAATIALVSFYEMLNERRQQKYEDKEEGVKSVDTGSFSTLLRKGGQFLYYTSLTTVIAQLAILPIALVHFQTVSVLGLLSNLVAVPILLFIVVPFGALTAFLAIFGFEWMSIPVLGWGLEQILEIASFVAGVHWAQFFGKPVYEWVLPLSLISGAMLILVRNNGAISVSALLAYLILPFIAIQPSPEIIIAKSGNSIAFRDKNKDIAFYTLRQTGFQAESYKKQWGRAPYYHVVRKKRSCDDYACLYRVNNDQVIANIRYFPALAQECNQATFVIIPRRWRVYCKGAAVIIEKEKLEAEGPLFVYEEDQGQELVWVNSLDINRRWSANNIIEEKR
jgi:competence protein ComEC